MTIEPHVFATRVGQAILEYAKALIEEERQKGSMSLRVNEIILEENDRLKKLLEGKNVISGEATVQPDARQVEGDGIKVG